MLAKRGMTIKNRGQITIFIVVGLIIVSGVVLFFLLKTKVTPQIGGKTEVNANAFLSSCIEQKTKEAINELSIRGGELNSTLNINFMFTKEKVYRNISYLCYTQNNFRPCVVQKPTISLDMQNGIKNYISDDMSSCFTEMLNNFKTQGFAVGENSKLSGFEVIFGPNKVIIQTVSEVTLTKTDETTTQKNFQVIVPSRIYEIIGVVQEVVNQEAEFCHFEDSGFTVAYPEFSIDKYGMESGVMIYTIGNKVSGEKFRFAVRSCAILPGF